MINFTRAFDLAWERMMVILFRPFHPGKWFAIGLSAFLAGFLSGGNGFSGSYNSSGNYTQPWKGPDFTTQIQQVHSSVAGTMASLQTGVMILLVLFLGVVFLALWILIYWLGARGQFLLLDNVVRNRGAIAWPWRAYARQANSLFLFYLLYFLVALAVLVPFLVLVLFAALPLIQHHRWPEGAEIPVDAVLAAAYLLVILAVTVLLFLFLEWGVPLMFRNGLSARAAFRETWGLLCRNPGAAALFVLLRIALFVALVVVSVIVCCLSCCLGALPYLGTVFLLPAILFIKCFTLDCLAQFGPAYDVWTVDVPPAPATGAMSSLIPPPPPG